MKDLSPNTSLIKFLLIIAITGYALMQLLLLSRDLGLKRTVNIESVERNGTIVINDVKYKTISRTQAACIVYEAPGPFHFLLMNSGITQESFLGILLNLSIAMLLGIFMWKFDIWDPFNIRAYKSALLIYRLILLDAFIRIFSDCYTKGWADRYFQHFQNSGFKYNYGDSIELILFFWLPALTAVIYLYQKAVKNREEIDLTV